MLESYCSFMQAVVMYGNIWWTSRRLRAEMSGLPRSFFSHPPSSLMCLIFSQDPVTCPLPSHGLALWHWCQGQCLSVQNIANIKFADFLTKWERLHLNKRHETFSDTNLATVRWKAILILRYLSHCACKVTEISKLQRQHLCSQECSWIFLGSRIVIISSNIII